MSKVALQGNASGTGTLTVAAPNTDSDYTLTLPAETGTVLTSASSITAQAMNGPAFSATKTGGNQALSNSTWTVLQYADEEFDTANCYDGSTYTFTPNVGGYYMVTAYFQIDNLGSGEVSIAIEKNGTRYIEIPRGGNTTSTYPAFDATGIVYLNGTTDYIKIAAIQTSGTSRTVYFDRWGRFAASLVRAA